MFGKLFVLPCMEVVLETMSQSFTSIEDLDFEGVSLYCRPFLTFSAVVLNCFVHSESALLYVQMQAKTTRQLIIR